MALTKLWQRIKARRPLPWGTSPQSPISVVKVNFDHMETDMDNQAVSEDFPEKAPAGVWTKKLPMNIGTIVLIRNYLLDNIFTKFNFEITIFFPVTFFLIVTRREFYVGSKVPEHRDGFEPIFGFSTSLLLRGACKGGQFKCEKMILKMPRLTVFSGTRYLHSVSTIEEGSRDMLLTSLHFAP
jgi:hypothetical protein